MRIHGWSAAREMPMLFGELVHPEILQALGAAGHGSTVLVSDGNFPHATAPYRSAPRVYLNFAPDRLNVTDIIGVLRSAIPVESAALMGPGASVEAPIAHAAITALLAPTPITILSRDAFYDATAADNLALVIATADTRPYANVLLTIGVRAAAR